MLHEFARGVVGHVNRIALGRHGQVDERLRKRQFAFGRAQALVHVGRVERELQRARIGQADVFARHADHAPGEVARVGAAIEHAAKPIKRGIGVGAAHAFVQGADAVVEGFAAFVETTQVLGQGARHDGFVDATFACDQRRIARQRAHHDLEVVEQLAAIAIARTHEQGRGRVVERDVVQLGRGGRRERASEQFAQFVFGQRGEHIDRGARQQGRIHLEARVLGGGPHEDEQTAFHMRQQRVLLAFVEAMDLVDEQQGLAPALRTREFGLRHRLADVLHAREHGRQSDVGAAESVGHQARERGLAHTGRPPEDHRMRLVRFERDRERFAGAEQVPLADHLGDTARAQAFWQWCVGARGLGAGFRTRRSAGRAGEHGFVVE